MITIFRRFRIASRPLIDRSGRASIKRSSGGSMLFRSTTGADLDRVLACTVTEPISWIPADRYRAGNQPTGSTAPNGPGSPRTAARSWPAPSGEAARFPTARIRARWSCAVRPRLSLRPHRPGRRAARPPGTMPSAPRAPQKLPQYDLNLPNGWRGDPAVSAAVGLAPRRRRARTGLTGELERLRYEWTPGAGVPRTPAGRLTASGLSPTMRCSCPRLRRIRRRQPRRHDPQERRYPFGAERQAREDMDLYRSMPDVGGTGGELAYTADGRLAGLAMPNRNPYGPVVGYLGVVPELRGGRYIDDILAEITRFPRRAGCPPGHRHHRPWPTWGSMAAAFERAGYRNYEGSVSSSRPPLTQRVWIGVASPGRRGDPAQESV